jgi:hypothetical protein
LVGFFDQKDLSPHCRLATGLPDAVASAMTLGETVMSEPSQTVSDIQCAVCTSSTSVLGYGQQFGTLAARWGYGTRHDGERYNVRLCESCFFQTLAYLREQRRIHTLLDDEQPQDEQVFGRVVRDDFFGES